MTKKGYGCRVLTAFFAAMVLNPAVRGGVTSTGFAYLGQFDDFHVGADENGSLRIDAGSKLFGDAAYVGEGLGTGTATVTGPGSWWWENVLNVGNTGKGILNVENCGQVTGDYVFIGTEPGAIGTVNVRGAGSLLEGLTELHVGYYGNGALNIENGGQVGADYVQSAAYIGTYAGPSSTATVSGSGSTWRAGGLVIGDLGSGTLVINSGGQVINNVSFLGNHSGTGAAQVSGSGAIWSSASLYVGNGASGVGTIAVNSGGIISSSNTWIGNEAGASGAVNVVGAGSTFAISNRLFIGYRGSGTLTVSDSGLVTAKTLYASLKNLRGNGTIISHGAVLDQDLTFDSTHGLQQSIAFGSGGTLNLVLDGSGELGVGYKGVAKLRIAEGLGVSTTTGYVGCRAGSSGSATVTGAGTKWATGTLYVGQYGAGLLAIEDGAQINNEYGYVGFFAGASGSVTIGSGCTWTGTELYIGAEGSGSLTMAGGGIANVSTLGASLSDLHGSGMINAKGAVLDSELIFDRTHSTCKTLAFGTGGTLELTFDGTGSLGAGYKGTGSLRIADGLSIASKSAYIGHRTGSLGTAEVSGPGSKWIASSNLLIGYYGVGELVVESGAYVSNTAGSMGGAGGSASATVIGPGSRWVNSSALTVGSSQSGPCSLRIADGGQVAALNLAVSRQSTIMLHVSGSNMLCLGNSTQAGSITSQGTFLLYSDAFLPPGQYMPVADSNGRAMTWLGTGTYTAVGGLWNATSKTFTVLPTAIGNSSQISSNERWIFVDGPDDQNFGASFGLVPAGSTFSAALTGPADLAALAGAPGFSGTILDAWTISTNLPAGTESMLSFDLGLGLDSHYMEIWRLQNGTWSRFTPKLKTYDSRGILSFTTTDYSAYAAVSVPEPQSLALLLAAGVLCIRRRRIAVAVGG